jgi:glycosyltransferase involved in cell wall biosynthesis
MQHNLPVSPPLAGRASPAQARETRLLVVAIPAFNEVENVRHVIRGVLSLRDRLLERGVKLKVVVINDGSVDETARAAEEAGADQVVTHHKNLGLGAAVRSGLDAAAADGADICLKIDADLQHNPNDILSVIDPILANEADLVYGERFSKISYKMPLIRRLGNRAFRVFMRWLTKWPIEDSQPGIFAVNRDYLQVYDIPGDYNYTQQILIDAYLKGMRFSQVSVEFEPRRAGKSFVSLIYPFKVLPQIVLVIAMTKPMKIFGTCGMLFLLFGTALFAFQLGQWMLGLTDKPVTNVNLVLGASLFGLQMVFFGILAKLVVLTRPRRASQTGRKQA